MFSCFALTWKFKINSDEMQQKVNDFFVVVKYQPFNHYHAAQEYKNVISH